MGGQRARREAQQGSAFNGFKCGVLTVSSTVVKKLSFSTRTKYNQQLLLQADPNNGGFILIGPFSELSSSNYAAKLAAGQFYPLNIFNSEDVGVLGTNDTDKVSFGGEG